MRKYFLIACLFPALLGLSLRAQEEFDLSSLETVSDSDTSDAADFSTDSSVESGDAPTMQESTAKQKLPSSEVFIGMKDFNPRLTENMAEKFKAADAIRLQALLRNKKVLLSLNVWKLSNICKGDTFNEIGSTTEGLQFLSRFLRDSEWLENFLDSGPIKNPDAAVSHLAAIFAQDPTFPTNPVWKKLATATALEYARNGWPESDCLDRYTFYRKSHEYKQLNPVFDTLDYWDMRIVAGCKNDDWGSEKNLTWMRDNVRLPIASYCGAAYQVPYRLENYFGDSIHGSDYYRTFIDIYSCRAEMSREVGAVCGGLSHYGAFAALANGVPALTMGEPGHCAYAVRVDGVWRPCNSVFAYRRGAHWNFFGPEWSMLLLTQEIMTDKDALKKASTYQRMGDLYAAAGNIDKARNAYVLGLKEQPKNIAHWRTYIDWEIKQDSLDIKSWQNVNESVCKYFAEDYPELCLQLLNSKVYPSYMAKLDPSNRLNEISRFHKLARKLGPLQWDMGKALTAQFSFLGQSDSKAISSMVKLLITNHAKDSDFGGMALSWCQQKTAGDDKLSENFINDISKLLARPGSVQQDALLNLADSIVLTAQKNNDIAGFQSVGTMMRRYFKDFSLPKYKGVPGEMLSKGGLIKFSSYEEDPVNIWKVWGILEPCGGFYKSDKDLKDPNATVLLPCQGLIQGVVIMTEATPKDAARDILERTLLIEASEDGSSWTKLGEIKKIEEINTLNIMSSPVRAKQIKITRTGGGKGNWILKAVHVYGRRVS